jgi:hypothetical protein
MSAQTLPLSPGLATDTADTLTRLAREFAFHPLFGDPVLMHERTLRRYRHRVTVLGEKLTEAAELTARVADQPVDRCNLVLLDPTVRIAINTLVVTADLVHERLAPFRSVLSDAARVLAENAATPPLQYGLVNPLPLRDQTWIWAGDHERHLPSRVLREAYDKLEHNRSIPITPDADGCDMLDRGVRMLEDLLPDLTRSALAHVPLVAIVGAPPGARPVPFDSFTAGSLPGTIVLSRKALTTPWKTAELVLHECLHQKWYDLQHTHSMLRRGYHHHQSPRVRSVWNRAIPEENAAWPCCRSVGALHVYVHLAVLFALMERRQEELTARYGPIKGPQPAALFRRACDRAAYLAEQIPLHASEFGEAGRVFLDWLQDCLKAMDRDPPARGATGHLIVDLYAREVEEIRGEMPKAAAAAVFSEPLQRLDQAEREVINLLGLPEPEPYCESGRVDALPRLSERLRERQTWLHGALDATRLRYQPNDVQDSDFLARLAAMANAATVYGSCLRQ